MISQDDPSLHCFMKPCAWQINLFIYFYNRFKEYVAFYSNFLLLKNEG